MQVFINGNPLNFDDRKSIFELLCSINISKEGTAVAVNNSIIRQSDFETIFINENDRIEIIRAVGGG